MSDETELLPPIAEVPEHVLNLFGEEGMLRLEKIGGAVSVLGWPGETQSLVATMGLSRMPLDVGLPTELVVPILPDQLGAAQVALRLAVEQVAETHQAWQTDRVWYNEIPFLNGTSIQGLVVVDGDPATHRIHGADGSIVAMLRRLVLLTSAEARTYAVDGPEAFWAAVRGREHELLDVNRAHLVRSDTVPNVACLVSVRLDSERPGYVVVDAEGAIQAFEGTESDEFVNDPANLQFWSLQTLVEREPALREFVSTADPGEFAEREGERWVRFTASADRVDP